MIRMRFGRFERFRSQSIVLRLGRKTRIQRFHQPTCIRRHWSNLTWHKQTLHTGRGRIGNSRRPGMTLLRRRGLKRIWNPSNPSCHCCHYRRHQSIFQNSRLTACSKIQNHPTHTLPLPGYHFRRLWCRSTVGISGCTPAPRCLCRNW